MVETSLVSPVSIAGAATEDCGIACKQLATDSEVIAAISFGTEATLGRQAYYTYPLEERQGMNYQT